jgi:hypothetical protein
MPIPTAETKFLDASQVPASPALNEDELVLRGKELLASDKLDHISGKGSRTLDGARRTSEALAWLDHQLGAATNPDGVGVGTEFKGPAAPDLSPVAARLEAAGWEAALREWQPNKSKAEILREKIELRGSLSTASSTKSEYAGSGHTFLSVGAQSRLRRIKECQGNHEGEHVPGGKPEVTLWADQAHRQRSSLVHVRPFQDLSATSRAAREAAAPHIADIYDQIFVNQIDETCGVPDSEPIDDCFQDCRLVLDEQWDAVDAGNDGVGGERVGRRSHFERCLTQNISRCLSVPLHRVRVNEMHPGPSWYRVNELIVELTLLPDAGGHPPSCTKLCKELYRQAKTSGSLLRQCMPALRVEVMEQGCKQPEPDLVSDSKLSMSFSLLRGGIVGFWTK